MRANRIWAAQASALGLAFALAGCGGGDGGTASTPPPVTSGSYTKIADMSGDRTFQTVSLQYNASGTGFTNGATQAFGTGATVAYTEATDTYKLTAPDGSTASFGPADVTAPPPSIPNSQQWSKVSGTKRDQLILAVPTVNGVALSYTIFGSWMTADTATNQATFHLALGGAPTNAGDMPRTGSANYSAATGGAAIQGATSYSLSGNSSATFSANFASNSVSTSLTLGGTSGGAAGPVTQLGTFNGTGTISASGPGFAGTLNGSGATGAFAGAFFGPRAVEMGYNWFVNGPSFSAVGTAVGVKQ